MRKTDASGGKRQRPDLKSYFTEATAARPSDVKPTIWNDKYGSQGGHDAGQTDAYGAILLEQYKLYVEMADRVSARRGLANTFFLTLNTAVFTVIGVLWKEQPDTSEWWLTLPLAALLTECMLWFWTLRSYRQLNSGKFAVIGALEERLPAHLYWQAEWAALGEGKDPSRYWPITHIEQRIPLIFASLYLIGFLALVLG